MTTHSVMGYSNIDTVTTGTSVGSLGYTSQKFTDWRELGAFSRRPLNGKALILLKSREPRKIPLMVDASPSTG